jgi:hypothetical protein
MAVTDPIWERVCQAARRLELLDLIGFDEMMQNAIGFAW